MRKLFIGISAWNTLMALTNVFILPKFIPDAFIYITPVGVMLPILIPIAIVLGIPAKARAL